ncbi:MAG: triose-phosphate isomerase [Patescibacteria group bacterium]|nr:triose-phosphate isomerase [Patescibacteria group bacterium]
MTKKQNIVVANFKMNLNTKLELDHWFANFLKAKKNLRLSNTEIVLCPPFLHLDVFTKKIKSKLVEFGTQNCFWEQKGAFTGEVSPAIIRSLGGRYVILGHSERRKYLGESDEIVALKVAGALKAGLYPILCVGENAREKQNDMLFAVVSKQLKSCLSGVSRGRIENVTICYESVWAISANKPDHLPTSNEIMGVKLLIKKILTKKYGSVAANRVRVIYGGSVVGKTAEDVCVSPGVNGALVGGASLVPYDFIKIAQIIDGQ